MDLHLGLDRQASGDCPDVMAEEDSHRSVPEEGDLEKLEEHAFPPCWSLAGLWGMGKGREGKRREEKRREED